LGNKIQSTDYPSPTDWDLGVLWSPGSQGVRESRESAPPIVLAVDRGPWTEDSFYLINTVFKGLWLAQLILKPDLGFIIYTEGNDIINQNTCDGQEVLRKEPASNNKFTPAVEDVATTGKRNQKKKKRMADQNGTFDDFDWSGRINTQC